MPLPSVLSPLLRRGERKKTRSETSSQPANDLDYCSAEDAEVGVPMYRDRENTSSAFLCENLRVLCVKISAAVWGCGSAWLRRAVLFCGSLDCLNCLLALAVRENRNQPLFLGNDRRTRVPKIFVNFPSANGDSCNSSRRRGWRGRRGLSARFLLRRANENALLTVTSSNH